MTSRHADASRSAPAFGLLAVVGAVAVGGVLSSESTVAVAGLVALLAAGITAVVCRGLRRPLLVLLFVLAPIDLSKAVIAPLTSIFHAAGPYYSPGLYLSLAHMVLLVLLPVWLGGRAMAGRRLPFTGLDAMAVAFLAWIWLRSIGTPQGLLSIGTATAYSLVVLGYWVVSHAIESRADLKAVLRAALAVFAATLAMVAAQAVTHSAIALPGAKGLAAGALISLGSAGETFRPPGFMDHPNSLAHFLVIVLGPAFALVLVGRRALPRGVWWLAAAVLASGGAALLLTLSRGGWVAAAATFAVVLGLNVRRGLLGWRHLLLLAGAVAVAGAVVLVAYPSVWLRLTAPDGRSLESRGLLVDMAWTIIRTHPWTGIGFGDFNRVAFQTSPPMYANVSSDYQDALHQLIVHNHYLLLASELGVPAMLFFALLLWRFAAQAAPLVQWRDPLLFGLATGLTGAIAGQALFLSSDNYYVDVRIFLLWMSAGLLQALRSIAKREAAVRRSSEATR